MTLSYADCERIRSEICALRSSVGNTFDVTILREVPRKLYDILVNTRADERYHAMAKKRLKVCAEAVEKTQTLDSRTAKKLGDYFETQLGELIKETNLYRDKYTVNGPSALSAQPAGRNTTYTPSATFSDAQPCPLVPRPQGPSAQELKDVEAAIAKKETEITTLKRQIGDLKEKNALLRGEIEELREIGDPTAARRSLQAELTSLPATLIEFVRGLLEVADHIDMRDRTWVEANLDQLGRCVYGSPDFIGLSTTKSEGSLAQLLRIVSLQEWAHGQLQALGVVVLAPSTGGRFDSRQHDFSDHDLMWVNDNPDLDDCVHSLLRVGFVDRDTRRVIRKALVRRYVYVGPDGATSDKEPDLPPTEELVPETPVGSLCADAPQPPTSQQENFFSDPVEHNGTGHETDEMDKIRAAANPPPAPDDEPPRCPRRKRASDEELGQEESTL